MSDRHPHLEIVLLALGWCACSSERIARPLRAQEGTEPVLQSVDPDADYRAGFYSAQGVVVGVRGYRSKLAGDFDGHTTLSGPDTIFIPDADEGDGYSLAMGWMDEGNAFLLSYRRIEFEGEIGGLEADVEYRAFALEIMRFLRANEPLQPYLLLEFLVPFADLEDASTDGGATGNAELSSGLGAGLGGGLAWWISPHLALDLRAHYDYQWFSKAEGVRGDSEEIDDDVDASSYGVSIGLSWALGRIP